MGIEDSTRKLEGALVWLQAIHGGLTNAKASFEKCDAHFTDVLPLLEVVIPSLIKDAADSYETGTQALRAAKTSYAEVVIPNMQAAEVENVGAVELEAAVAAIKAAGMTLDSTASRVLKDFFSDEMFDRLTGDVGTITNEVNQMRHSLYEELLSPEEGLIPKTIADNHACKEGVKAYLTHLKTR